MVWEVNSDVTLVAWGEEKALVPLCQTVHDTLTGENIPDVGIQFHEVSPAVTMKEAIPS